MGSVTAIEKARKRAPELRDPAGRPMPHNAKVEAALLLQVMTPDLMTPETATMLRTLLPEHLYNPNNQRVLTAAKELAAEGVTIEPFTLYAKLQHAPAPMGGWDRYLHETLPAEGAGAEARPAEYAKILLDRWRAREVMRVCAQVLERGFEGVDSTTLLDETRTGAAAVADTQVEAAPGVAGDALMEAWRNLTDRKPGQRGLTWGWPAVNRAFGRMMTGRMTVVAAVPGVGKTNIAWHVAEANALEPEDEHGIGEAVYFVSGELKAPDLVGRQAGIRAGVPAEAIEGDRPFTEAEIPRLVEAQEDINSMPIVVDDNGGRAFTVADIEARVRAAQTRFMAGTYGLKDGRRYPKNRLRLVIVDYLTKLKAPVLPYGQRHDGREREVAAISGALTEMAKVLDVHVLVIAAVSRGDKAKGVEPKRRELQMSDLRESGMIEYDAANIIFANEPEDGVIRLKNAKQRFRSGSAPVELVMVRGRIFEREQDR